MKLDLDTVKALRKETGASLMMVKQALEATGHNCDDAKVWIEKNPDWRPKPKEVTFSKIFTHSHNGRIGVMLELSCGTDFVANTEDFDKLGHEIALQLVADLSGELEDQQWIRDPNKKIMDLLDEVSKKTGEVVKVQRTLRWSV